MVTVTNGTGQALTVQMDDRDPWVGEAGDNDGSPPSFDLTEGGTHTVRVTITGGPETMHDLTVGEGEVWWVNLGRISHRVYSKRPLSMR